MGQNSSPVGQNSSLVGQNISLVGRNSSLVGQTSSPVGWTGSLGRSWAAQVALGRFLGGLGRFQNALGTFQEAPERESLIFPWFLGGLGGVIPRHGPWRRVDLPTP